MDITKLSPKLRIRLRRSGVDASFPISVRVAVGAEEAAMEHFGRTRLLGRTVLTKATYDQVAVLASQPWVEKVSYREALRPAGKAGTPR